MDCAFSILCFLPKSNPSLVMHNHLKQLLFLPESLSVSVKTKEDVSLLVAICPAAARLGPTDTQPSGWQKYTMSSGRGKSS